MELPEVLLNWNSEDDDPYLNRGVINVMKYLGISGCIYLPNNHWMFTGEGPPSKRKNRMSLRKRTADYEEKVKKAMSDSDEDEEVDIINEPVNKKETSQPKKGIKRRRKINRKKRKPGIDEPSTSSATSSMDESQRELRNEKERRRRAKMKSIRKELEANIPAEMHPQRMSENALLSAAYSFIDSLEEEESKLANELAYHKHRNDMLKLKLEELRNNADK